jgi:hypothetical protein
VKNGRIRFIALASRAASRTPVTLRSYLKQAGIR